MGGSRLAKSGCLPGDRRRFLTLCVRGALPLTRPGTLGLEIAGLRSMLRSMASCGLIEGQNRLELAFSPGVV